jgi:hypothetical protein
MPLMRRRPLLRAAAVGGGAYVMGKRHAAGQQQEAGQDQRIDNLESTQRPASPGSGGISEGGVERLEQLGKLHEQGVLSDEEFSQEKAKVLAG